MRIFWITADSYTGSLLRDVHNFLASWLPLSISFPHLITLAYPKTDRKSNVHSAYVNISDLHRCQLLMKPIFPSLPPPSMWTIDIFFHVHALEQSVLHRIYSSTVTNDSSVLRPAMSDTILLHLQ